MANTEPIITERLRLVSFSDEFLTERYVAWLNNHEVMRFSEGRFQNHTLESCMDYMESFKDSPNYLWAIVAKEPSIGHIGNLNAYINQRYMIADVGILIGENKLHGKGYGKEAFCGIVDYLFRFAGMRKVTAGAMSVNIPMLKIMESAGMKSDGTRKKHYICDGKEVDIVHMAIFKD